MTRVCGCKGSLSHVHESCLLRWLDNSNTSVLSSGRRCEICHTDYRISYEFESVQNIVKNAFSYAFAD
jgi:E3 ubiquitin-protein ligase DOA10